MSPRAQLPLAVLLGLVVRVPFWSEAQRTPVDGDTAIIGLMARHPLRGTTMWGQPYGSPVEAWLVGPLTAAAGWTDDGLRLAYFLLGLALIPLAWALGRTLHPRAALPAALLAAALVVGAYSAYTVIEAGHSGAKASWHDTPVARDGGDGDADGD